MENVNAAKSVGVIKINGESHTVSENYFVEDRMDEANFMQFLADERVNPADITEIDFGLEPKWGFRFGIFKNKLMPNLKKIAYDYADFSANHKFCDAIPSEVCVVRMTTAPFLKISSGIHKVEKERDLSADVMAHFLSAAIGAMIVPVYELYKESVTGKGMFKHEMLNMSCNIGLLSIFLSLCSLVVLAFKGYKRFNMIKAADHMIPIENKMRQNPGNQKEAIAEEFANMSGCMDAAPRKEIEKAYGINSQENGCGSWFENLCCSCSERANQFNNAIDNTPLISQQSIDSVNRVELV